MLDVYPYKWGHHQFYAMNLPSIRCSQLFARHKHNMYVNTSVTSTIRICAERKLIHIDASTLYVSSGWYDT